jgi:ElaB/YqjD/DUF883 family membrane-anchored ribosome-binding protein
LIAQPGEERKPVPDPTELTTEALKREIAGLKELVEQSIRDHAELCHEKFDQIDKQFEHIEHLRVEQKSDTEKAVEAALTALKEIMAVQREASQQAIDKSERATGEQLNQLRSNLDTETQGLRRSIDDNKERIGEVGKQINGVAQQRIGAKEDRTGLYATIGVVVAVLLAGIAIVGFIAAQNPVPSP